MDVNAPSVERRRFGRLAAVFLGTTLALAIALASVLLRPAPKPDLALVLQQAIQEPAVRERVIAGLVASNPGIWDSHNDGTVGRVLQQGLRGRLFKDVQIQSNDWGLRERPIDVPKPQGTVRVVLLGDSLIFGEGISAEERVGVFLERFLAERAAAPAPRIEVLHVGIGSWNVLAECAFLRRQLSLIDPDLVFHLTTSNDLDDADGVHGFGSKAPFSPQRREAADSRVVMNYPEFSLGIGESNNLVLGIDYESRSRYEAASLAMQELERAVVRRGARYVAWFHWGGLTDFSRPFLTQGLSEDEMLYNSRDFAANRDYWLNEQDSHWNRRGMERMAKLLYGAIQARGLLPSLGLSAWNESLQILSEEHDVELEHLAEPPRYESFLRIQPIGRDFAVAELSEQNVAHVNGGLDRRGRVSPYASFMMLNSTDGKLQPGTRVRLRGRGLGRPEIDGVRVRVYADDVLLDTLEIPAEGAFEHAWPVPAEIDGRRFFSVRLAAEDYAYDEQDVQHCVVFELEQITIF
jgi:hypothetical protein